MEDADADGRISVAVEEEHKLSRKGHGHTFWENYYTWPWLAQLNMYE